MLSGPFGKARQRRPRRVARVLGVTLVGLISSCAGPATAAQAYAPPGSPGEPANLTAIYLPSGPISAAALGTDASVITRRMAMLGFPMVTASAQGQSVVVFSPGSSPGVAPALAVATGPGNVRVRPVRCFAPHYDLAASSSTEHRRLSCTPAFRLTEGNLGHADSAAGGTSPTIGPDPALAVAATTPPPFDAPAGSAVLAGVPADPRRYVVGPNGVSLRVASAVAVRTPSPVPGTGSTTQPTFAPFSLNLSQAASAPDWVVDFVPAPSVRARWDATNRKAFHGYLAFDVDGVVVSTDAVEPEQRKFTAAVGEPQTIGQLTQSEAQAVVAVLVTGPLPAPLSVHQLLVP